MDNLNIVETDDTPYVYFDAEQGVLEVTGKSLPENINIFYDPVVNWIKDYVKLFREETEVNLRFEYLNSASSKKILEVLMLLKQLEAAGSSVEVNWYYRTDDEDMYDEGSDFSTMTQLKFNYLTY